MILQRIATGLKKRDWGTVVLEVLIVVVGIFIGLQVDDWNESRKDRAEETRYLVRLKSDIMKDLALLSDGKGFANEREVQIRFVESLVNDPDIAAQDPNRTIMFLEQASWVSYLPIGPRTYDELQSSGRTTLIRDENLRNALGEYYRQIARWEIILKTQNVLSKYRFASAGLLSGDQLVAVENSMREDFTFPDIDAAEAVRVAKRFSRNDEAIRWLPQMLHYHALAKAVIGRHEAAANAMIADIENALNVGGQ